ncbi:PEP-CTERM sorting domain-containing protein [Nitrosomonas sp.]|uniref:PEP-CTERM sorting domain-containing protein n=1 Tax=Nitrosomonas sp. TaxID=42353 RepID=UPI0026216596|nr:PEP-CTERM sorting domain-containing protein [Nitrosomonas sp.]
MNLKSGIKYGTAVAGIVLGLSISSAHAGIAGSMVLDITGGCFSYGATGATGCGNTDSSKLEYATGSFIFNNTLSGISNPATYAYLASVSLHATDPNNIAAPFNDTRSKSFATLGDLQSDPLWNTAYTFVNAVLANPAGSFTATLPPLGPLTASWNYTADPGSTPAHATGSLTAWSSNDLNGLAQLLFNQALPASPVNFSLNVTLSAIPEPATIALIGLGILGMGTIQRRKISATLPVC